MDEEEDNFLPFLGVLIIRLPNSRLGCHTTTPLKNVCGKCARTPCHLSIPTRKPECKSY